MSRSSSSFLIDWRPSRGAAAARGLLAVLAALSLVMSDMPLAFALAGSCVLLVFSARKILRDLRRAAISLRVADDGAWVVWLRPQTRPSLLREVEIGVRGPLAWVRGRDGRGRVWSWMWWPDSVDPEGMRKLRLACGGRNAKSAPSLATMQG